MKELHLRLVGKQLRQLVRVTRHRISRDQRIHVVLEFTGYQVGLRRVAVDVNSWRVVVVH